MIKSDSVFTLMSIVMLFCTTLTKSTPATAGEEEDALVAAAAERCVSTAAKRYKVTEDQISFSNDRPPKYNRGLRGVVLVLSFDSRVVKRTCVLKKTGQVVFSRNTSLR